jgi:Circadian oscillating protein COP23
VFYEANRFLGHWRGPSGCLHSSTPSYAAKAVFACTQHEGKLATVVKTKKGNVPLVIWDSSAFTFSGYSPSVRCQKVTQRFRGLYSSGKLKYLAAGRVRNQPVICATTSKSASCNSSNMLFTLKPGSDPRGVLQQLNAVRNRAAGSNAVEESASTAPVNPSTDDLVDMEDWLQFAAN